MQVILTISVSVGVYKEVEEQNRTVLVAQKQKPILTE